VERHVYYCFSELTL